MTSLIWLTIALPLLGVLINGFFGRRLSRKAIGRIGAGTVVLAFIVAFLIFLTGDLPHHSTTVKLWDFITIGAFDADISLLVDPLSMVMTLVVTGVGALIHIYAIGYMDHDENVSRFFTYLNLFVASMLILVLTDNYLGMYIGWELVGVCSYLLIGFWFERPAAADAGKKAFIVNRVGDFGFALGVFLIWSTFGSLNFHAVFEAAPEVAAGGGAITAITALLFIGAIGKSAQIPLHVWLPDAMEGPTPVSALIHAATMVTAGIYMVVRSNALYALAPTTSAWIAVIGAFTAIFAASIALVQFDLKRVLAYSTISQLGYMVLAVGVGAYSSGIFHLVTHAFFKALLFMGAGSVMHAMHDVIDMRRLGGLKEKMPATFATFVIGGLALAGFPLTAGFFSKDEILARTYEYNQFLYIIGLVTAFITAFYTFRAVIMTFYGEPKDQELYDHAHENSPVMTRPLWILAVLSLIGGLFIGLPGLNWIEGWLEPIIHHTGEGHHLSVAIEFMLILVSSIAAIGGIVLAYEVYIRKPERVEKMAQGAGSFYNTLLNKYYIDEMYDALIVQPGKLLGRFLANIVDVNLIDLMLVDGSARLVRALGRVSDGLQTGYLRNYILSIFIGSVAVMLYFLWG